MAVPRVGPLVLVFPALVSCVLAAPQGFMYSTTTYQNPYVPIPFARLAFQDYNEINHNLNVRPSQAVHVRTEQLAPAPYHHFLPASLPQAIYSEPTHILSGYSYQTLDPAGAKSQVLFVSGPNSQRLFRQNANLLHIVLPSLFNAGDQSVVDSANTPQYPYPANTPQYPYPANTPQYPYPAQSTTETGGSASSEDSYDVETRTDDKEDTPAKISSDEIMTNGEDVTPKNEEKSPDEQATSTAPPAEKSDDATTPKSETNSEESSSVKPTDSTENSPENPAGSEKDAASDQKSDSGVNAEKSADETVSDAKPSDTEVNEKPSEEKPSEEKKNEDSTTDSSNVSTTPATE